MINEKIINYLDENEEFKLTPEYQERFRKVLLDYGVNPNSALFDLMTTYAGEFNGKEGFIINVADDLADYNASVTKQLLDNERVSPNYISLFNFEFDDYLLYNKNDDSVVLIEGANTQKLLEGNFDKKWDNFEFFLEDFFEL